MHLDARDSGLSLDQRALEWAMIDTLENPTMVHVGASQIRMEAVQRLGILQPALDAADSIAANNSMEKMMAHQQVAMHHAGMRALERAIGAGEMREPDPVNAARWMGQAARCFDVFREHALALVKLKSGGKQTVVVQHVNVSDGGQAVIAGNIEKGGGGSGSRPKGGRRRK